MMAAVGTITLRVITEWVGLVSQFGVNFPHEVAKRPSLLSQVWGHWDAGYYLCIAQYGYAGRVVGPGQAVHGIAFAPMYPWGIRFVHGSLRSTGRPVPSCSVREPCSWRSPHSTGWRRRSAAATWAGRR